MNIGAREAKRLEWLERIERQARSGLTVAKFCEQESIGPASFYQWKRKLTRDTPDTPQDRDRRPEFGNGRPALRSQTAARDSTLAPQVPAFVQLPTIPQHSGSGLVELTAPNGMLIRVPAQNLAALELILSSIHGHASEEPRC